MTPGWPQDGPGWRQDGPRMAPRVPKGGKRRRIRIGSDSDHNRIRLETDRGSTMARQGGPEVKMTPKMDPKMDPKTLPKVIPKLVDFRIPIGKPFWCSWRSHGSQGWPQVGASRPAESAKTIIFVTFQRFSGLYVKLVTKPLLMASHSSQNRFWSHFGARPGSKNASKIDTKNDPKMGPRKDQPKTSPVFRATMTRGRRAVGARSAGGRRAVDARSTGGRREVGRATFGIRVRPGR